MADREKIRHFVPRLSPPFQFILCWRTQTAESDSFPCCQNYSKSNQGAVVPIAKRSSDFWKPNCRCEHRKKAKLCFYYFFFFSAPKLLFALFEGIYCLSVALSENGLSTVAQSNIASSDGTHILCCFLLKMDVSRVDMSVHPIFFSVYFSVTRLKWLQVKASADPQ